MTDDEIRLECLRLAVELVKDGRAVDVVKAANIMFDFFCRTAYPHTLRLRSE